MVEITIKVVIKCTKIPNLYPKKTDNNNIKKLKKRERRGGGFTWRSYEAEGRWCDGFL